MALPDALNRMLALFVCGNVKRAMPVRVVAPSFASIASLLPGLRTTSYLPGEALSW
jgi:hypothetical protein